MFANVRQTIADWIFRNRFPEAPPVTLVQRRIFILPTRHGYGFAFMLLLLLVASINYTLSLGFVLTFLLAAMGGIGMLHTWRNLAHLKLRPGRNDPVFAGDAAHFAVNVQTPSRTRFAVGIRRRGEEAVFADIEAADTATLTLAVPASRRGRVACGRMEIFTRYPVGFFHAWSYFDFGASVIVYPRPDRSAGPPSSRGASDSEEGIPIPGDDEFNLLRPYRGGDPPRQIAWKALARGQDLLTKEFNATASSELWLDWDDARGADPEARLSALAHWVMEAERLGQGYGLRIPGTVIAPERGESHRARCLEALALYGDPRPQ